MGLFKPVPSFYVLNSRFNARFMNKISSILLFIVMAVVMAFPADAQRKKVKKKKVVKTQKVVKKSTPMIAYQESYGSVCCPKDKKWDGEFLHDYIKRFNTENNTNITDIYEQMRGREGERIIVLTLKELDPKMREKFIKDRIKEMEDNDKQAALHLMHSEKPITDFINQKDYDQFRVK